MKSILKYLLILSAGIFLFSCGGNYPPLETVESKDLIHQK